MKQALHQGDILKIESVRLPALVVSKDFFNQTGEVIACPVYPAGEAGPLHIPVRTERAEGLVQCEKLTLLDLNVRGWSRVDRISMADIINITDAIQGIFDYI